MNRRIKPFLRWQYLFGVVIICFYVGVAITAPYLAPPEPGKVFSPYQFVPDINNHKPAPPQPGLPLGTVGYARTSRQINIYYTLVWGTRTALRFGLLVTLLAGSFGILFGAVSGYFGGKVNRIMMRVNDAFIAFPLIAGVAFFTSIIPFIFKPEAPKTLFQSILFLLFDKPLMLGFIFFSWMPYARITNIMALRIKETLFIQAAKAMGAGHLRILFRHFIPHIVSPAIVLAARDVGAFVLLQATFTFIGLGGDSEWGAILIFGQFWIINPGGNIFQRWWVFLPAALVLISFGIGWNLLGDGLNEWMNPRISQ